LNPDGSAFDKKQQESIEKIISDNSIKTAQWQRFQSVKNYPDAIKKHIDSILTFFPDKYKLKVVMDCDCGAGSVITPELLKMMGCEVIELNCEQSGYFPHDIEPTEKNLTDLMEAVRESGADLGIAHDGDADRMMAIDDRGRFIDGDKMLVIMARELGAKKVITTIDASMAIEEAGFEVMRTSVGDNYISQELKRGGDIGGEPSGSWVFPRKSLCPDGIYAAAMLVSTAAKKRLSSLVDDITGYYLIRGNIGRNGVVMARLEEEMVSAIQPLSLNRIDGLKLNIEDGWILVRASGTEPKIRITVEAKTEERAKRLFDKSIELIEKSTSRNGES
jgi:phosphoglucosamine mutase